VTAGAVTAEAYAAPGPALTRSGSLTSRAIHRLLRKKIATVALVAIACFYLVGVFAPFLAPYDYAEQDLDNVFASPSLEHPFGTDRLGRDVLSRVIWASRTTVIVTAATVLTGSVLLPLGLGMLAGYRGGFIDSLIMRAGEILSSVPALPLLILINVTLRPRFVGWVETAEGAVDFAWIRNTANYFGFCESAGGATDCGPLTSSGFADYFILFFALSLFGWVGGARLIRSQVMALRSSEYILASEAAGARTSGVIFRHVLPNVMPLVIVGVSASLGTIALAEIGLTFLGVGIQPPHPSFGALISDGASRIALENHPQLLLVPAVVVGALIFAFNLLGDAVNDVLTPRAR
jgi:ABC-type dipeptide/oligopeptide/nickel transport system permease subunit